jgi:hypothetical protein
MKADNSLAHNPIDDVAGSLGIRLAFLTILAPRFSKELSLVIQERAKENNRAEWLRR